MKTMNAFEELTQDSPLMGSDESPTFDAEEAKRRIQERRNKLIEYKMIDNPNSSDGNKESQRNSENYT